MVSVIDCSRPKVLIYLLIINFSSINAFEIGVFD